MREGRKRDLRAGTGLRAVQEEESGAARQEARAAWQLHRAAELLDIDRSMHFFEREKCKYWETDESNHR